jgi:hypothetical protein
VWPGRGSHPSVERTPFVYNIENLKRAKMLGLPCTVVEVMLSDCSYLRLHGIFLALQGRNFLLHSLRPLFLMFDLSLYPFLDFTVLSLGFQGLLRLEVFVSQVDALKHYCWNLLSRAS